MLRVEYAAAIKKDLKKIKHDKKLLQEFRDTIKLLANEEPLPVKNRDHRLTGNWVGYRECHVRNDVLLIYKVEDECVYLARFGSHSELF